MPTQSSENPFDRLENAAGRSLAEEKAATVISTARTKLVMGKDAKSVFFATLALGLRPVVSWDIETMATDGKRLLYNPEFTNTLTVNESIGVMAHETLHIAAKHHARRGSREHVRFNRAADLAINDILKDAGYTLPKGGLVPGEGQYKKFPKNLSAEEYYTMLPDEPEGQGGGNDPGQCGGVMDAGDGSPAACREAAAEADVSVAQAANAAKQRGTLPGGIARMVDEVLAPQVDWRDVLRQFLGKHTAKDDVSWSTPNRRFIGSGLYLPGRRSEAKPTVVLLVDTSGSIGAKELAVFGGELQGILESSPCVLHVAYADTQIQKVDQWSPGEGDLQISAVGGGGTSHVRPFEQIDEMQMDPDCVVCLTDLCTAFPDKPPAWPVIWASTDPNGKAPFGEVIVLK